VDGAWAEKRFSWPKVCVAEDREAGNILYFKGLEEDGRELLNGIMAELEDSGEDRGVLVILGNYYTVGGGMLGG